MKTIENTDKTNHNSINNNDTKITEKNEKNGKNDGEKINSEEEERIKIKKERDDVVTKPVSITPKQYEEQESEQIKISVELLSSAIKALESHIVSQNNSSASGASASGSHSSSNSNSNSGYLGSGNGVGVTYNPYVQPSSVHLGHILSGISDLLVTDKRGSSLTAVLCGVRCLLSVFQGVVTQR